MSHFVKDDASVLSLQDWQAHRKALLTGTSTAGADVDLSQVRLVNTDDVSVLAAELSSLKTVILHFPKFTDGRAYTQAQLLRKRLGFTGEIRATGDVLVDQLSLMQRCGFSSFVLREDQNLASAERALAFFNTYYQGDTQEHFPAFRRERAAA